MIWSTDLTETLELENLIDQAAQETFSAEVRKESHEARAHVDFPERDDENWAKHALSWLHKPCVENAEVPGSTVEPVAGGGHLRTCFIGADSALQHGGHSNQREDTGRAQC